jgi:hypothetical protein
MPIDPFSTEPGISDDRALTGRLVRVIGELQPQTRSADTTAAARAFGALLKDARRRARLSPVATAERTDLNPVYLALVENGLLPPSEIPVGVIFRLSIELGIGMYEWPVLPWAAERQPTTFERPAAGHLVVRPGFHQLADIAAAVTYERKRAVTISGARGRAAVAQRVRMPAIDLADLGVEGELADPMLITLQRSARQPDPSWYIESPLLGVEPDALKTLSLQVAKRWHAAQADERGLVRFDGVRPERLDRLEFTLRRSAS